MPPIALITNYLPPYRVPLYRLLAERHGVEVHCFGGEAGYVAGAQRDLERQLADAPFPAHRLARQRDAAHVAGSSRAVIAALAGRVAVPAAWRGARRGRRPFVLLASLWRHPLTAAHVASFPFMRHVYRHADAILTYGEHVSRYVARYRGSERNVLVAPQAVEADLFGREVTESEITSLRQAWGLPPMGRLVLYAGRLVPEKGVGVLLRAWDDLGDQGGTTLCLAGDGPLRGPDQPGVRFLGHVARDTLPVAYAAADVVVVPSLATRRFLEPWGLVCNEAMHQGRAVIASAAVGAVAGGLVAHGLTGLVIPSGDERRLGDAIRTLLGDDALRTRIGDNGHAAVADYTYEAAAAAFAEALRSVDALRR
jgi:glycosyltransferase involved in cell wall biosynthesis